MVAVSRIISVTAIFHYLADFTMDNNTLRDVCQSAGIIPVLVINDSSTALPLAEVLVESGLNVIEVTLRTDAAWDAVRSIRKHSKGVVLGVGSVLRPADLQKASDLGVHFCVSPGFTPALLETAKTIGIDYLPGVSTISEMLTVREQGFSFMKFFPAELSGGWRFLQSVSGPIPDLAFCPTGGVTPENVRKYIACSNVVCVGGTWMVREDDLRREDYAAIQQRSIAAVKLIGKQRK